MSEALDLILSELVLNYSNMDIVDHIKVSPKFLKYLEANITHQIICTKSDERPNGIIVEYKGVPMVIDDTIEDNYKLEYKHDSYFGKLVDTKIQPIKESDFRCEWDGPKTKYDYLFMSKENNNV